MLKNAIILFGATGDLAQRMLFPSLFNLELDGLLPKDLIIIASSRTNQSSQEFAEKTKQNLQKYVGLHFDDEIWARLNKRLSYQFGDIANTEVYEKITGALGDARELMFYLSTSPSLYGTITQNLAKAGLAHEHARIIVEKPIGHDLASSKEINEALASAFTEEQIFRIDHYLGKETVQNLLALRFANIMFEPLWNKASIEHVQITISETVGVEDRWAYYNEFGAIRDMVQNHLLQLLCLVAMEPPASEAPEAIRAEKVKVLRSLRPITKKTVKKRTVRGQYTAGMANGEPVAAYSDEKDGSASDTETFVAIRAQIDNWRWAGVPFYLRTGKCMPKRETSIVIQFRDIPHSIFPGNDLIANRLVIELQPNEDISFSLMNKIPTLQGSGRMQLASIPLDLSLSDLFKEHAPRRRIAYERLLLEAINNNPTLFVRRDEVEAAWEWVDSIVDSWGTKGMTPTKYAAGMAGPSSLHGLTERNGHSWFESEHL